MDNNLDNLKTTNPTLDEVFNEMDEILKVSNNIPKIRNQNPPFDE